MADSIHHWLLAHVPDAPAWVETRGALLDGGRALGEPGAAVVVSRWRDLISIVGRPSEETFEAAFDGVTETVDILAQMEDAAHGEVLMDMPGGPARIYAAGQKAPTLPIVEGDYLIEELSKADLPRLRHLPVELLEELADELGHTPIVAAIMDGLPVSFCYAGSRTERWWDVSIDTWEPHRRRGLAAAAFGGMYERMASVGRRAVWGATEWNTASWRLAEKLGLERVGELMVWQAHTLPEIGTSEPFDE